MEESSGDRIPAAAAKSNRGSGVSMPINRNGRNFPMEKGFGPDLQYMHQGAAGYNPYMMQHPGAYPILVNPPPMPTV